MDGISYKKWMDRIGRVLVSVMIAVLLTMLFLAVFAFAMLKGSLSASVEKIGLIVMSVIACFVGGFFCGKKIRAGKKSAFFILRIPPSGGERKREDNFRLPAGGHAGIGDQKAASGALKEAA